jgi:hypothetical protein
LTTFELQFCSILIAFDNKKKLMDKLHYNECILGSVSNQEGTKKWDHWDKKATQSNNVQAQSVLSIADHGK